jgi:hypothetical protein
MTTDEYDVKAYPFQRQTEIPLSRLLLMTRVSLISSMPGFRLRTSVETENLPTTTGPGADMSVSVRRRIVSGWYLVLEDRGNLMISTRTG